MFLSEEYIKVWAAYHGYDKDIDDLKPQLWLAYHYLFEHDKASPFRQLQVTLAARCIWNQIEVTEAQVQALGELAQSEMSQDRFKEKVHELVKQLPATHPHGVFGAHSPRAVDP